MVAVGGTAHIEQYETQSGETRCSLEIDRLTNCTILERQEQAPAPQAASPKPNPDTPPTYEDDEPPF